MKPQIDTLWFFALALKSEPFTAQNILCFLFLAALFWLVLSLIYWAHPGGHAWGKHSLRKFIYTNRSIPGPRGVPVIGSMKLMSGLAHHRIAAAAEECRAKRLMAFSLGETRVIVACNPEVAKEILNSSVFADRPVKESAYSLMFSRAIGFAPYGIYWRTLRRIAATHLFSPKQIKASENQRFDIADQMVKVIGGVVNTDRVICVRDVLKRASLSNMMCSVFGRRYGLGSNNPKTEEVMELVDEGYELLGILNWSDHLPWLADFDLQKVRGRCSELVPKVNRIVSRIVAEHRERAGLGNSSDFVDVLISLQGSDRLSDADMIAVLWEMIFRGTDTVAVLVEWILARVVLHPDVQSRLHDELDRVVGTSRAVTESDVTNMIYLSAVIKEVLRLHPPSPLLSWARLAITDTTIDGYHVPEGTTAMANIWAIMRDPDVWSDPLEFKPQRFFVNDNTSTTTRGVEMEFSALGTDLRLAPFGSGSRVCPGKAMGLTTVSFWVASLLHEFDWLPSDDETTGVDLTEVLKLSCEMANPLTVKVRHRRIRSLLQES